MAGSKRRRKSTSTVIAKKVDLRERVTATQILNAADMKAGRAGESSVILGGGDRISRAGLGVSVKLALAVSIAIAIFMGLFGVVIYNSLEGSLNQEIDAAGVMTARALTAPDFDIWSEFHLAYAGTSYAKFEREIASGEKKIRPGALTDEELRESNEIREYNRNRLAKLLGGDNRILDVLISKPDRTKIVRLASNRKTLDFAGIPQGTQNGVSIEYGTYTPLDGKPLRARSFVAPIMNRYGNVEGKVTVVLSGEFIQQQLKDVRTKVIVLAIIFIALGIAVAFVMGSTITSSLTDLTRDVEIISKGNLDHHPRVHTRDEIGVLARTIERMARGLKEAQDSEVEHQRQKHQLSVALEIQSSLFPEKLPELEGYEVAAHYQPGPEVGGDYYDVFVLPDGKLFLMVASASGKGIPAAMLTAMARSFTTAVSELHMTPGDIFKKVNNLLSPDLRRGMYVTAIACVIDPKSGKMIVANAGHNPLVRYVAEKKGVKPLHSDGIALGFDKGPVFDRSLQEIEVQMEPGDRFVLCTPGVFGITNREGTELGESNFYRLIAREGGKSSEAFVNLVAHTLEKYVEGGSIDSDITFVTVKRTG